MKRILLVCVVFCTTTMLVAQEQLSPLLSNPQLQNNFSKSTSKANKRVKALTLPFADDFYYAVDQFFPDTALWTDNFVFVNTGAPVDPPTLGVATFDGLNALGLPYGLGQNPYGDADVLTSKPINLAGLTESDDVYLSFFFQPQGNGDAPEFDEFDPNDQDFLIVEFKSQEGAWQKLWEVRGTKVLPFEQIFLKIEDDYLFDNFQFRFRNTGELNGAFDVWHVDYIKIDKNRDPMFEQNLREVAFQYPPSSLLKDYFSIPFCQFDSTILADTHSVQIKNNFSLSSVDFVDAYKANISIDGSTINTYAGPSTDLLPQRNYLLEYSNFDIPTSSTEDTVVVSVAYSFDVTAEDTTQLIVKRNNSIVHNQVFANYLAYDDGIFEIDFWLRITDVNEGKVAQRHHLSKRDTLRAIRLPVANHSGFSGSAVFSMVVWKSLPTDSTDEEIVYREDLVSVSDLIFEDSIRPNAFSIYTIDPKFILSGEERLILDETFYVGYIQQVRDAPLRIGYDVNRNNSQNLFYQLSGNWIQSGFSGSLMLNPVFGPELPDHLIASAEPFKLDGMDVNVYPVPAQDRLYIEMDDYSNVMARLSSIDGKVLMEQELFSHRYIDISTFADGMYVLSLLDTKNFKSASRTIVKMR